MRVLITGCAGFIGSHLVDECLARGHKVVGIDNLSTGSLSNIEHQRSNPNFSLFLASVEDYKACLKACEQIDVILHHAALGSVLRSIDEPCATFESNTNGFHNILVAATATGVKKVVYASSSSVYGIEGNLQSPYAVSKKSNELYAQVFTRNYNLTTIGLRYFNVFGPRQNAGSLYSAVIPKWADRITKGMHVEINGNGSTSRDFTYVKNVVNANMLAIENKIIKCGIYDIGCGETTTLHDLYAQMKMVINPKLTAMRVYKDFRAGDIPHSKANTELAKKDLGYNPTWSLQKGLEDYLCKSTA